MPRKRARRRSLATQSITGRIIAFDAKGDGQPGSAELVFTVKPRVGDARTLRIGASYEPGIFAAMASFVSASLLLEKADRRELHRHSR